MPTGPEADALHDYEKAFIDKGFYAEAFRNKSGSKRKPSGAVMKFIVDDLVYPLAYASWNEKKGNYAVWTRSYPDQRPYVKVAQAALKADVQSDFAKGIKEWGSWKKGEIVGVSGYALELPGDSYDTDFKDDAGRKNYTYTKASAELQNQTLTSSFNQTVSSKRTEQDARNTALPALLTATKSKWESTRKTFVETARTAEQLTIEQQNNALTAKGKAAQAESAYDKARDFSAAALSARQGAEGAALVADLASTQ
jgi:hypothetical protein